MRAVMDLSEPDVAGEPGLTALLVSALEEEVDLLETLRLIFVAQREALAKGDPAALDDGVFAATRVLRTLDEARRRRRGITTGLVGSDVDFEELDSVVPGSAGRSVRAAQERVRTAAAGLRTEVSFLRRILTVALSDNRRYLDALLGEEPGQVAAGYEAGPVDVAGAVLDRSV